MLRTLAWVIAWIGCSSRSAPVDDRGELTPPARWSDRWILEQGERYLTDTDTDFRRAALESSLTNHGNLYSKQRLASYGLGSRGWDKLPVWNPRSRAVTAELAARLERGEIPEPPTAPLWDGIEPTTMAGWISLGRKVFFEYPMRAEVYLEYGMTKPALAAAVGVERTSAGDVPGLVVFANIDGETRVGITCAICHSNVEHGTLVIGAARRTFDYGRLRLAYAAEIGAAVDPELARRMASWGPGRADVTEDDSEDPVTIPDLWGLRVQSWLTQAGTIRHDSPLALAIRQETQLTDSNHAMVRPPRALAWALAMYVYALAPPAITRSTSQLAIRGERVFAERCASCHENPAYGGRVIALAAIGTDPALTTSRGRGTGGYRVPPLVRVGEGAPYLHDGAVTSLAELLSTDRLTRSSGHRAGTTLGVDDREALIAFLDTL